MAKGFVTEKTQCHRVGICTIKNMYLESIYYVTIVFTLIFIITS